LIAYNKTREYREQQEKQTASAQDAVRLARLRYDGGSTSYLEVLTNDANLYSSQLTLETARQQEALSLGNSTTLWAEAGKGSGPVKRRRN
jgi:outer membrane protein, multidrug efflux system